MCVAADGRAKEGGLVVGGETCATFTPAIDIAALCIVFVGGWPGREDPLVLALSDMSEEAFLKPSSRRGARRFGRIAAAICRPGVWLSWPQSAAPKGKARFLRCDSEPVTHRSQRLGD